MNSHHKRQSSSGSFNIELSPYQTSFSNVENFMIMSKLMQDEIMVPSKLKDKIFESKADQQSQQAQQPQPNGVAAAGTSAVASKEAQPPSDVLDQYRFILLIRNQLMQTTPFKNIEEYNKNELKHKKFKQTYENLRFHYTELMSLLDNLSMEAKTVTDIYKENV